MRVHVLTLFPEFFSSPLNESIVKRARNAGHLETHVHNIRDFATDKHNTADDVPFGGGAGMVMKVEPLVGAIENVTASDQETVVCFLTPQGTPLTHELAVELSDLPSLTLVCGHYEGIDQRVRDHWIDREISIGDYVLTGGEPAALVVLDAVVRLIPGVLGNAESLASESFTNDSLDHPQYTRPRSFRGYDVPEVLLSGDHKKIAQWRAEQSERRTKDLRPDLINEAD